jgi:hypothetical protein
VADRRHFASIHRRNSVAVARRSGQQGSRCGAAPNARCAGSATVGGINRARPAISSGSKTSTASRRSEFGRSAIRSSGSMSRATVRPRSTSPGRTVNSIGSAILGIEVVGGLVHHGSGPPGTDLLDADFPARLADYAAAVAERYPWIVQWTPINEPLTTARFSALYGLWYPHHKSFDSFARSLVNQCLATVRAMGAIRRVTPAATLIQTEDIGRTYSTPELSRQADHDSQRRWLSLDLSVRKNRPSSSVLCQASRCRHCGRHARRTCSR